MNIAVNWTCPKCRTVNVTLHNSDETFAQNIEYCDTELGGCDEMFVVKTTRQIIVAAVYETVESK